MKLIAAIACAILLSGCASKGINIAGSVQEVKVPILYCPAPPSFNRPDLEINGLTDAELRNDGKVAQAYAASVLQLIGYTQELEKALKFYDDANRSYDEIEQRLRANNPASGATTE